MLLDNIGAREKKTWTFHHHIRNGKADPTDFEWVFVNDDADPIRLFRSSKMVPLETENRTSMAATNG